MPVWLFVSLPPLHNLTLYLVVDARHGPTMNHMYILWCHKERAKVCSVSLYQKKKKFNFCHHLVYFYVITFFIPYVQVWFIHIGLKNCSYRLHTFLPSKVTLLWLLKYRAKACISLDNLSLCRSTYFKLTTVFLLTVTSLTFIIWNF